MDNTREDRSGNVESSQRALDVVVSGHVQGVGYRYFCLRRAKRFGICGWARNCPDGTVQVMAVGSDEAIEKFVIELERGPKFGRVDDVSVTDLSEIDTVVSGEFLIR